MLDALAVAVAVLILSAAALVFADWAGAKAVVAALMAVGSCAVARLPAVVSSEFNAVTAAAAAVAAVSACAANAPCEIGTALPLELVTVFDVVLTVKPDELVSVIGVVVAVVLVVVEDDDELPPPVETGETVTTVVVATGEVTAD